MVYHKLEYLVINLSQNFLNFSCLDVGATVANSLRSSTLSQKIFWDLKNCRLQ